MYPLSSAGLHALCPIGRGGCHVGCTANASGAQLAASGPASGSGTGVSSRGSERTSSTPPSLVGVASSEDEQANTTLDNATSTALAPPTHETTRALPTRRGY